MQSPPLPGCPLARVLVVADAGHHLPRIAAVAAPEQRRRLDAAQELLLALARLDRPDVDERAAVVLGKCRRRLRLLEALPHVGRAQHLHPEERIAARGVQTRRAARVDERRVHRHAWTERPAQREARRVLPASATNTPFLVPIVRMTDPPSLSSRNRRQDREHVPRRERRVDSVEVAHVVRS